MPVRTNRHQLNLDPFRNIPILSVAERLRIQMRGGRAICFSGHDKQTPSLTLWQTTNTWKCFGACGLGGDTISLAMHARNTSFRDAVAWLASEFSLNPNVSPPLAIRPSRIKYPQIRAEEDTTKECPSRPDSELFYWLLEHCSPVTLNRGLKYLESHGISTRVATKYRIRELRDPATALRRLNAHWGIDRVVHSGLTLRSGARIRLIWTGYTLLFPFFESGKPIYIQGRGFGTGPKFMGLRGLSKPLFNASRLARLRPSSVLHICEGIPDALAMESKRLAAVAVLGAASFKDEWVDLLAPFEIVAVPDGDAAGKQFRSVIAAKFRARGKSIRHLEIPESRDASDLLATMRTYK